MDHTGVNHSNIRATDVKGTDVYNRSGEHLGHIDDLILNKADGRAEFAVMSFGGFLGIGEEYHPIPWKGLNYDPKQGGYIVDLTRDQLNGAPRYAPDHEPDWNDRAYGQKLYGYYGL